MITAKDVKTSIRKFSDCANDLLSSDFNNFDDTFARFMNFCETDVTFNSVHLQLLSVTDSDFDAWYGELISHRGSFVGSATLRFPLDDDSRLSLQYQLLRKIYERKLSIVDFSMNFFAVSGKISEMIYKFNEVVTSPFIRDLSYKLDDLHEELPKENSTVIPVTSIQIIQSAKNVVQQSATGNNISQSATQNLDHELVSHFDALVKELKSHIEDDKIMESMLKNVDAARELASSEKPNKTAVETLLSVLPKVGSVVTFVKMILDLL